MRKRKVKKLSLSAETLRVLDGTVLNDVAGGTNANTVCAACDSHVAGCTATNLCSGCRPCF
jgi:hypothetical protein